MANEQNHDFLMEKLLRQMNPELHKRFTDAVFALQHVLTNYKLIFPEYTDHTSLHTLTVIDFCNRLIGDQIGRLNADELYVLLTACYFHDTGMGITMQDYEAFSRHINFGDYFDTHSRENLPAIIRDFHHEYSGQFIRKYADVFEIPSREHEQAIIQVARGHRKTDLMDEQEYPLEHRVPDGNNICLPYLAALIRLADEVDVAAARNPVLLYDIEALTDEIEIVENKKVLAVRSLQMSESAFTLIVSTPEEDILEEIRKMVGKMQRTLDCCRAAVNGRTPYVITQEKVLLEVQNDPTGE